MGIVLQIVLLFATQSKRTRCHGMSASRRKTGDDLATRRGGRRRVPAIPATAVHHHAPDGDRQLPDAAPVAGSVMLWGGRVAENRKGPMLDVIRGNWRDKVRERRLRLFVCGCAWQLAECLWAERLLTLVESAEGLVSLNEVSPFCSPDRIVRRWR
jgi:hypothetical protein